MSLVTFVDEENNPLVEVWYSISRDFKEFNKALVHVTKHSNIEIDLNQPDEQLFEYSSSKALETVSPTKTEEDASPTLESNCDIKASFIVRFAGEKPYKFPVRPEFVIQVGKPYHLAICHNRCSFCLMLNDIKRPYLKL